MTSQPIILNTEAAILARLIPPKKEVSRDVAEYLVSIDFDPQDLQRMNTLAEGAREGTLSTGELAELDSYLHVGNLLSILQSKARLSLRPEDAHHLRSESETG